MTNHLHIIKYLLTSRTLLDAMASDEHIQNAISAAAEVMTRALNNGNKIISCGNGGSMSDAMHFTAELIGRYKETRDPLAAICLSDPGAMSCISNDFGYPVVFSRQVRGLARPGDVLLAISTSGRSANVFRAMEAARACRAVVIGLTGAMPDGNFVSHSDVLIKVPSIETGHVQECHINIIHLLVELIEKDFNLHP